MSVVVQTEIDSMIEWLEEKSPEALEIVKDILAKANRRQEKILVVDFRESIIEELNIHTVDVKIMGDLFCHSISHSKKTDLVQHDKMCRMDVFEFNKMHEEYLKKIRGQASERREEYASKS